MRDCRHEKDQNSLPMKAPKRKMSKIIAPAKYCSKSSFNKLSYIQRNTCQSEAEGV